MNMYNISLTDNNITYSLDMIRLKTYIPNSVFSEIEFRFKTAWKDYVKKYYNSARIRDFFYNYVIEIDEGVSFWFGYLHNNEKRINSDYSEYNFTIEFNPNKVKNNKIIKYLLSISKKWFIKSLDLACDLKINILDIITDFSGRKEMKLISKGFDNKTIYFGKGDGRVKIYNKKIESNLDILGNLTRVEVSREFDDFDIKKINSFSFGDYFPKIYTNDYMFSFSDYKDKTLLAILYAVQNGFPIKDLSRVYKQKIKSLLEGGYKIQFNDEIATKVIYDSIIYYFDYLSAFIM